MKYFRSLAWGYHEPGGIVLWWHIALSRHLHIAAEFAFEQLEESEVAERIRATDAALLIPRIAYTVATPELFERVKKPRGFRGETISDRLATSGIIAIPADDDRLNGWQRCQSLLRSDASGRPWLTIAPSCVQLIRAIPSGLMDPKDADEVRAPVPALTAFRYGAMTRPAPDMRRDPVEIPVGSPAHVMQELRQHGHRRFGTAA